MGFQVVVLRAAGDARKTTACVFFRSRLSSPISAARDKSRVPTGILDLRSSGFTKWALLPAREKHIQPTKKKLLVIF